MKEAIIGKENKIILLDFFLYIQDNTSTTFISYQTNLSKLPCPISITHIYALCIRFSQVHPEIDTQIDIMYK